MKRGFIVYFADKTAVVILASNPHDALSQLDSNQVDNVTRVDCIPYPVL